MFEPVYNEISVFHYSTKTALLAIIIDSDNEILRIRIKDKHSRSSFCVGDPIVLGFTNDNIFNIIGCDVISSRSLYRLLRAVYEVYHKKVDQGVRCSMSFGELEFAQISGESMEEQKLKDYTRKLKEILKNI